MKTQGISCDIARVTEVQTSEDVNERKPQSSRLQHLKTPKNKTPYTEGQREFHWFDVTFVLESSRLHLCTSCLPEYPLSSFKRSNALGFKTNPDISALLLGDAL